MPRDGLAGAARELRAGLGIVQKREKVAMKLLASDPITTPRAADKSA